MDISSINQVRYNAPWHDLKHVCVGTTYGPEFYEPVANDQIRRSLQTIAQETAEDLDRLVAVLSDFGIRVARTWIDPTITLLDYVDDQGRIDYKSSQSFTLIPRPPMQPRDSVLIVNDVMVLTNSESQWVDALGLSGPSLRSPRDFDAPLVTVVGDRLIADCRDHAWLADFLDETFPDHKTVPVMIGGHNDAVFSVIAPGQIVSTYHHTNYNDTFPGWQVKYIENQSWNAIPEWRHFKHDNRARWWVPEDINNPGFQNFVDTWLAHWVGLVAESVFDVNMLQLDRHHVLVNNFNQDLFRHFATIGIEPIIVPFRHRFFWDGGLHCVTNDLYREGSNENYF